MIERKGRIPIWLCIICIVFFFIVGIMVGGGPLYDLRSQYLKQNGVLLIHHGQEDWYAELPWQVEMKSYKMYTKGKVLYLEAKDKEDVCYALEYTYLENGPVYNERGILTDWTWTVTLVKDASCQEGTETNGRKWIYICKKEATEDVEEENDVEPLPLADAYITEIYIGR